MTALERIKEIEGFSFVVGTPVPKRYNSSLGAISQNVAHDIEFLLRAFKVMHLMAHENISPYDRYEGRYKADSVDGVLDRFNKDFEERMKE